MTPKSKKTTVLRARCEKELKMLVEMAARQIGLDPADLIRMAAREKSTKILGQTCLT